MKLEQKEVAERIGVHEATIFNWEANTSQPALRSMPGVIEFLGYNPLPEGEGIGEWLIRQRTSLGMSQREAAKRLGIDPSTLARRERGEREPEGEVAAEGGGVAGGGNIEVAQGRVTAMKRILIISGLTLLLTVVPTIALRGMLGGGMGRGGGTRGCGSGIGRMRGGMDRMSGGMWDRMDGNRGGWGREGLCERSRG